MNHGHGHDHDHRSASMRRLAGALTLTAGFMVAEVVGGLITGSLALLADAGHMLSDAASLGLALFATWIAGRPASTRRTYGYQRAEILASLVHAATLLVIAIFVAVEAFRRFAEPPDVQGPLMGGIAVLGLVVNLGSLWILSGSRSASLNVRGAWLHVMTDTLGSLQALLAAAAITWLGWTWADPAASLGIAVLVVWSGWRLLAEAVDVLLESVPRHLDPGEIEAAIRSVKGVDEVHDLHVWTITSGFEALTVHVTSERANDPLLEELRRMLRERFGLDHTTIQIERREGCPTTCGPEAGE
jgi:cobalt-zinc-cadmium efflux system protein